MSKELEALNYVWYNYYTEELSQNEVKEIEKNLNIVQDGLKRLEAIDNAEPSEALECLERIGAEKLARGELIRNDNKLEPYIDTIKQALLKAQEPKHYLKWEDLELSYNMKNVKVKMGDNEYIIRYFLNALDDYECFLCDVERNQLIRLYKQFFNDLHLERVE